MIPVALALSRDAANVAAFDLQWQGARTSIERPWWALGCRVVYAGRWE